MKRLIVALSVLFILLMCISSVSAFELEIEKKGTYVYWLSYRDGSGTLYETVPKRIKGTDANIADDVIRYDFSEAKLHVFDTKSGNVAIMRIKPPQENEKIEPIKIEESDFSHIRNVKLEVLSEDERPLESAIVELTDSNGDTQSTLVTPADGGIAVFENVAAGVSTVKVRAEEAKRTIDKDIEMPSERKQAGFNATVHVAGDVFTLQPVKTEDKNGESESATDGEEESDKQKKTETSPVDNTLAMIIGFVFLGVVVVVVIAVLKAKSISVEKSLKKMGVSMPAEGLEGKSEGTGQPVAAPADTNSCPFCGEEKDDSGKCACSIAPPAASPVASSGPRLVGVTGSYSGQIFELKEDKTTVGRDESCDISLSTDSTASRNHAEIMNVDNTFTIADLGSSNGTFVNGTQITSQALRAGDEVQIGSTKFRFEL